MPSFPSPDAARPPVVRAEHHRERQATHPPAGRHDRTPLRRNPQQPGRSSDMDRPNAGWQKRTVVTSPDGKISEIFTNVNGRQVRLPIESNPAPSQEQAAQPQARVVRRPEIPARPPQERVQQPAQVSKRPEVNGAERFNFTANEIVRYGGKEYVVESGLDPQRVVLVPRGDPDPDGHAMRQVVTRDVLEAAGNYPMPLNVRMQKARTAEDLDSGLAAFTGVQGSKFHLSADQRRRVAHFIHTGEGDEFITKSAGVKEAALRVRGLLFNYVR